MMHITGIKNYQILLKELTQALKYLFVGVICQSLDFYITILLFTNNIDLFLANALGYFIGSISSYLGHTKFTFKKNSKRILSKKQIGFFLISCLIGSLSGYLIINFLVIFSLNIKIAKFIQLLLIAIIQYLINSRLTFKKKK